MRSGGLLVAAAAAVVVTAAATAAGKGPSACTLYCRKPHELVYFCCDNGNPYHKNESEVVEQESNAPSLPEHPISTEECYYFCSYEGNIYCCGETSIPIPKSHEPHYGTCAEEEDQVCKSQGIFLYTKNVKTGKTAGSLLLAEGDVKQHPSCASDGYCSQDKKCCPSHCVRRHICMKSLTEEEDDKKKND